MRLWPTKYEIRLGPNDQSGLGAYLGDLSTYLNDGSAAPNVNQTAAVQFALNMIGLAFQNAEPYPAVPVLTAQVKGMIARQLLAQGNAVFEIGLDLRLMPVAAYSIMGDADPASWRYTFKQQRPNGDNPLDIDDLPSRNVSYEGMVHVRYMPPHDAPWRGVSPFVSAGFTAESLAWIERSLHLDSMAPSGYYIPLPHGSSAKTLESAKTALTTGKGGITVGRSARRGDGPGTGPPKSNMEQLRYGALIPPSNIDLRDKSAEWLLGAAGIPPTLFRSDGSAVREGYRHFMTKTVEPIGAVMQEELSDKLEVDFEFYYPAAVRSDISARSRGYGTLRQAGMPDTEVRRTLGIPPGQSEARERWAPLNEGFPPSEPTPDLPNT